MPTRIRALDRKLIRDLWAMKGQSLAIASVIAAGVAMFVMYLSNFDSLERTRAAYYDTARFADVFALLKRAPLSLESRIAALPGVEAVSTRVVADVTLDVPGMAEPATGRLISLPDGGRPRLNDVYLRRGRWLDATRTDEVLASEIFCDAHGFNPGDRVTAIINGRRRSLTIVGVALSPEYVYAIRPGAIFPDKRQFGIFWMSRRALGSAFDMEGGFNDVSIAMVRGANVTDVVSAVDGLLAAYGGFGAIPRSVQTSAWMLDNELRQLQTFGFITPAIFLGVAAFILNVALARALSLQRPQIAALKALGYSNRQLAWHYIKWALVIAGLGALAGVAAGAWLGSRMIGLYNEFFRFPALDFHLSAGVTVLSVVISLAVAAAGAQSAVRRAVRIPPAAAMRPETPARYRRSVIERAWQWVRVSPAMRMILRNVERQPMRSAMSVIGIAFAVAVLFVGMAFIDVMNVLLNEQFVMGMRQDALVTFVEPRSPRAMFSVKHLPGVMDIEPVRSVPVRLRAGHRSRTLALTGLPGEPRLNRVVSRSGRVLALPADGLVFSAALGRILDVSPGDQVQVEVLEGKRFVRQVPVVTLVDDSVGLQAYMRIDALRAMLHEGPVITGAAVTLDPAAIGAFYAAVKALPAIAGVALTAVTLQNFRDTMAENMFLQIFLNVMFAGVIAFGVVYNSARVSLSERERELASLRVLGFTRTEISLILLGELAVLTLLALPVGAAIGFLLGQVIMTAFNNEVYRLSFVTSPATIAWSFLVVIAAALVSGLLVRRRLDRLDLVGVLKTRE
ncbi:MAG TPA: FtsX-like permease family protein [Vicinamibacterales bacterium]|nr:FtsX-like permease family protein [Vicinamibacterales bacterium]